MALADCITGMCYYMLCAFDTLGKHAQVTAEKLGHRQFCDEYMFMHILVLHHDRGKQAHHWCQEITEYTIHMMTN